MVLHEQKFAVGYDSLSTVALFDATNAEGIFVFSLGTGWELHLQALRMVRRRDGRCDRRGERAYSSSESSSHASSSDPEPSTIECAYRGSRQER